MSGKNCNSGMEKSVLYVHIRRLAMSLLAMLFVVFAFLVLSKAWFQLAKSITANGTDVTVVGTQSLEYELYKWDYANDDWFPDPVTEVNMSPAVPNEVQKYKVQCIFNDAAITSVILQLSTFTLPDTTTSDELFDFIDISHGTTLNAQLSNVPDNQYKYIMNASGANSYEFVIHISKDVCNYYSEWGMTGSLTVQ